MLIDTVSFNPDGMEISVNLKWEKIETLRDFCEFFDGLTVKAVAECSGDLYLLCGNYMRPLMEGGPRWIVRVSADDGQLDISSAEVSLAIAESFQRYCNHCRRVYAREKTHGL